jgi:hypothetical protein
VQNCICYNCTISGNSGYGDGNGTGGGVSGGTLYNCTIVSNSVTSVYGGGGVGDTTTYSTMLYNCLIAYNVSSNTAANTGGGGVGNMGLGAGSVAGRGVWLYNCTVVSNYSLSTNGGGVYVRSPCTGTFVNCIIYNNTAVGGTNNNYSISGTGTFSYTCTTPLPAAGANNISNNPAFASFSSGNFRLTPESPCVDRGTNQTWMTTNAFDRGATDRDGNNRIDGLFKIADMGCYEYFFRITMFRLP